MSDGTISGSMESEWCVQCLSGNTGIFQKYALEGILIRPFSLIMVFEFGVHFMFN